MANIRVKIPDQLISQISKLGNKTDEICEMALKEGAEIVKKEVDSALSAVVGNNTKYPSRSTSELKKALGVSPVKVDKNGNYDIKIGFAEPRSDGESNAKIANILEHGKSGQPPKPFLKPAKTKSRKTAMSKMIEVLETEMKKV